MIGLGRMARAILLPLLESGDLAADTLVATVARASSVEELSSSGLRAYGPMSQVQPAQSSFGKPHAASGDQASTVDALAETAPGGSPCVVDLCSSGVTLDRLQRCFPVIAVSVPFEYPSAGWRGLTALAWGSVTPISRQKAFASVGDVLELPEDKLDAFLALTSSGPAFIALVAEAMADGAVAAGLARDLAHHLAHRTLAGTAELLHQRALHPAVLKDMVSSPAGTTIAGLRALERGAVRSALIEAVVSAAERSRELA